MCYVTKKPDIPGYSMDLSTNKRVYCKLYTILYKSSQKFYSKMPLLHPIQGRSGMLLLVRLQLRSLSVELLQLN